MSRNNLSLRMLSHRRRLPSLRFRSLGIRALLLLLGTGYPHPASAQESADTAALEIAFLDVGQGDAIIIKVGHEAVLVDASRGADIVLYLEDFGVDTLVAAIASHNHDDHIGGMVAVLADHAVGRYFYNQRSPVNWHGLAVQQMLAQRGIRAPPPPWPPILLGKNTRISVFASPIPPAWATENSSSLGVLVQRGSFKALLTGDAEVEELNAWMTARLIPDVDVLKAAHHGARNGVTPGWLAVTKPEVVVISVGARNAYGQPDPWALRYYATRKRSVYRTDRDGTVIVTVDSTGRYSLRTLGPFQR